jgi:hypothetical protein
LRNAVDGYALKVSDFGVKGNQEGPNATISLDNVIVIPDIPRVGKCERS